MKLFDFNKTNFLILFMYHLFYKEETIKDSNSFGNAIVKTIIPATGYCTFNEECTTPIHLIEVNGTLIITDNTNTIKITIVNDVVSVPILIDDDIRGKTSIIIQEVNQKDSIRSGSTFGFGTTQGIIQVKSKVKHYQLSIGKLFKTQFIEENCEIKRMGDRLTMDQNGRINSYGFQNVKYMNISFKTESNLQLISNSPK